MLGKIILAIFIFFVFFTAYIFYKIYTAPESEEGEWSIFTQIKYLIMSPDKKLSGEADDRINLLLLGVGGGQHEGPYLTDTIIVASIKPSTRQVGIISIPRDLYVTIPGFGQGKINTAYALVRAQNPALAASTIKSIIEEIFNIPIHYFARVDFDGFVKIIDNLGGITIHVENTLEDPYYPVENGSGLGSGSYEHLVIYKGIRYMNGETALKYVRSRKAKGVEGSDFARSRRQQKVLLAIKEKLLSPGTLLNFNALGRVMQSLDEHIETNLQIWEILRLYDLTKNIPSQNINHIVLDDGPKSPLVTATSTGAYLIIPRSGDWTDLENIAKNIFEPEIASSQVYQPIEKIEPKKGEIDIIEKKAKALEKQKKENAIEIDNGTKIVGLAKKTSTYLSAEGYNILEIGNAPLRTYKKSILYNLKPDNLQEKKEVLKDLEAIFDAIVFESGPPTDVILFNGKKIPYPMNAKSDILIILGENWNEKLLKTQSNIR